MEQSPFRFVMIDDPVQAMDPARVDGLAKVLEEISQTHQVIVFTHDDRLPESVRRLGIAADVTEVVRQPGSRVKTRAVDDPVSTALSDAYAIAKTRDMSDDARRKVVPVYCRLALEAAAAAKVRRRRIGRGDDHVEVEKALVDAKSLRELMALALFDDASRRQDLNDYLKDKGCKDGPTVIRNCNSGAHGDFAGDPTQLQRDVDRLIKQFLVGA